LGKGILKVIHPSFVLLPPVLPWLRDLPLLFVLLLRFLLLELYCFISRRRFDGG
jgi:hypothetical protein